MPQESHLNSKEAVRSRVAYAIRALSGESPRARALRAQLRTAAGRPPEMMAPELWPYIMDVEARKTEGFTSGEKAVFAALTLWAIHQSNHSWAASNDEKYASIAWAAQEWSRRYGNQAGDVNPIHRRLNALVGTNDFHALIAHCTAIVGQCASREISMNYPRFAADLFTWQNPKYRLNVLRQWSRDASKTTYPNPNETESPRRAS